jgi:hypothetical protein
VRHHQDGTFRSTFNKFSIELGVQDQRIIADVILMQGELLRIITWTDQKGNNGWISVGSLVGGIFLFSTWEMNKSIRKAWLALSAQCVKELLMLLILLMNIHE